MPTSANTLSSSHSTLVLSLALVIFFSSVPQVLAVCGNGVVETGEQCDGGACCVSCQFAPPSTVCRSKSGDCDVAEKCTGTSGACPADAFQPRHTICRNKRGDCDYAERCNGTSPACPPDTIRPNGTVCRTGQLFRLKCQGDSICDGVSTTCPPVNVLTNGTLCRPPSGPCDAPEYCTGWSLRCPPNRFLVNVTCGTSRVGSIPLQCSGEGSECFDPTA
eukprot:TRINITY_DN2100_c0_g2_i1.p1 TRINITY_DN2100_c0_g2~~TRINITY_DN2100_c0_g2_i1.p1  ORF type:complete len:219 (-),score=35.62 TRINITY_DN2100_c0_g2_i1:72-728(-)